MCKVGMKGIPLLVLSRREIVVFVKSLVTPHHGHVGLLSGGV